MPDYKLEGLSSRSFEQLAQAISAKVIGPGIIIFGDGPDGGREATFDGRIPFPSSVDNWDGYGVIQAKFRQKPEGPDKDGDWLAGQLKAEFERFLAAGSPRRKPQYYILATNVVLTPPAQRGSKDKISDLFGRYKKGLGLREHTVWDYDWFRVQLDGCEDIRNGYSAWITPGDVLAEVIKRLRGCRPDFEETIALFLQKELLVDQYVNLEQAGHAAREKIPLGRVFVDLPVGTELRSEPEENAEDDQEDEEDETDGKDGEDEEGGEKGEHGVGPGFVNGVLSESSMRLDPKSVDEVQRRERRPDTPPDKRQPGRLVLVGGPGQGKTTIGQFVCQLFRASILNERATYTLEPDTHMALAQLLGVCSTEGLAFPSGKRFPIRVVLSHLARVLADKSCPEVGTLLSYLVYVIRRKTDRNLTADDLRTWLAAYPWLLVLDGLDEVPPSTNRAEVLDAIQDFWIDARASNADIMVVATTRPQGYSGEFSPDVYNHQYLTPLSARQAMHYSRRLVEARYSGDQDRKELVLGRLQRAVAQESTGKLMRSPLQITIMAALVERLGQPPQERYSLFKEYYSVIYQREIERDTPRPPCFALIRPTWTQSIAAWASYCRSKANEPGKPTPVLALKDLQCWSTRD